MGAKLSSHFVVVLFLGLFFGYTGSLVLAAAEGDHSAGRPTVLDPERRPAWAKPSQLGKISGLPSAVVKIESVFQTRAGGFSAQVCMATLVSKHQLREDQGDVKGVCEYGMITAAHCVTESVQVPDGRGGSQARTLRGTSYIQKVDIKNGQGQLLGTLAPKGSDILTPSNFDRDPRTVTPNDVAMIFFQERCDLGKEGPGGNIWNLAKEDPKMGEEVVSGTQTIRQEQGKMFGTVHGNVSGLRSPDGMIEAQGINGQRTRPGDSGSPIWTSNGIVGVLSGGSGDQFVFAHNGVDWARSVLQARYGSTNPQVSRLSDFGSGGNGNTGHAGGTEAGGSSGGETSNPARTPANNPPESSPVTDPSAGRETNPVSGDTEGGSSASSEEPTLLPFANSEQLRLLEYDGQKIIYGESETEGDFIHLIVRPNGELTGDDQTKLKPSEKTIQDLVRYYQKKRGDFSGPEGEIVSRLLDYYTGMKTIGDSDFTKKEGSEKFWVGPLPDGRKAMYLENEHGNKVRLAIKDGRLLQHKNGQLAPVDPAVEKELYDSYKNATKPFTDPRDKELVDKFIQGYEAAHGVSEPAKPKVAPPAPGFPSETKPEKTIEERLMETTDPNGTSGSGDHASTDGATNGGSKASEDSEKPSSIPGGGTSAADHGAGGSAATAEKAKTPRPTEPKPVAATNEFECVAVRGGFQPRKTGLCVYSGGRQGPCPTLGRDPFARKSDCDYLAARGRNGVVCSNTGIGLKPTHFSGSTAVRADFGFWGSSIAANQQRENIYEICGKATLHSTKTDICFWNGSSFAIGDITGRAGGRGGSFNSIDACLDATNKDWRTAKTTPTPAQPEAKPTPKPVAAKPSPTGPHPATGNYAYCARCHNDPRVAPPFPDWALKPEELEKRLQDPATRAEAQKWVGKLHKHLIQSGDMPPRDTPERTTFDNDPQIKALKEFLTKQHGSRSASTTQRTPQVVREDWKNFYSKIVPEVTDPELQAALRDPNTFVYDKQTLPPAYQDTSFPVVGVRNSGNSTFQGNAPFLDPQTRKLRGFGGAAGLDPHGADNLVNTITLPAGQKIKVWSERVKSEIETAQKWKWQFPVGTLSTESVYTKDSQGTHKTIEVRTRKKTGPGASDWASNIMRPFASEDQLLSALDEVGTKSPALAAEAKKVKAQLQSTPLTPVQSIGGNFHVKDLQIAGFTQKIPNMSEGLVHALLEGRPLQSTLGSVWKRDGDKVAFAATSGQDFSIVPKNNSEGAMMVSSQSCNRCHDRANQPIYNLYNPHAPGFNTLLNNTTFLYGNTPGNDGNLRWHPFDPAQLRTFGFGGDNRQINPKIKDMVEVIRR